MLVTCDKCGASFIGMLKKETKVVDNEQITRAYLMCPKCGEQYDSYYDNRVTLMLKKQIRKAFIKANEVDTIQRTKILRKIEKKKSRVEKEEETLKIKFKNKGE